jgi:hypothetical protein
VPSSKRHARGHAAQYDGQQRKAGTVQHRSCCAQHNEHIVEGGGVGELRERRLFLFQVHISEIGHFVRICYWDGNKEVKIIKKIRNKDHPASSTQWTLN